AAGLGFIGGRLRPAAFRLGGARAQAQTHGGRWVIDDATPTPDHARFRRGRLLRLCAIGALLWLLPMLALGFGFGWGGELARIGWFFSKVAVLSFGGAYAVLPYVYQGAVEHYGWLSAAQMIDGLALGETTPGPLIMLVAFVGFLGAHNLEA